MSLTVRQLVRVMRGASVVIVTAGCGSSSGPQPAVSPTTAVPTTSTSASTTPSGTYQTKIFKPAFSVDLPSEWTAVERDLASIQFFVQCDACAHGGEENGEITMDMTLGKLSPADAIAKLAGASSAEVQPAAPAHVASVDGFKLTAARTGAGEVTFADIGYRSEATGQPIDVFALDVGGRTLTMLVDPHIATGPAADQFTAAAAAIIESIQFAG